jgi:predicted alpha/beta-hydrolase family hydrolase
MGGRIAAQVAAADQGIGLAGLVFLGYPLHPPGKPRALRDVPRRVPFPMIFVQGTRDELGTAAEVTKFFESTPRARVHSVVGGDHSLALPRREGPAKQEQALSEAADAVVAFIRSPKRPARKQEKRR